MKEQHPIDELFRRQLTDYQMETPLHLWSGIESRTRSHVPVSFRSLIWCAALALGLAVFLKGDDASLLTAGFPIQAIPSLPQAAEAPRTPAADDASIRPETQTGSLVAILRIGAAESPAVSIRNRADPGFHSWDQNSRRALVRQRGTGLIPGLAAKNALRPGV